MRNPLFALVFGLLTCGFAHAGESRIVVECGDTHFSDVKKIQIQETDRQGQYQIIENGTRLSAVFGMDQIEKSELPALSGWNGYERKLIRYGRDDYSISIQDECTTSVSAISCTENF